MPGGQTEEDRDAEERDREIEGARLQEEVHEHADDDAEEAHLEERSDRHQIALSDRAVDRHGREHPRRRQERRRDRAAGVDPEDHAQRQSVEQRVNEKRCRGRTGSHDADAERQPENDCDFGNHQSAAHDRRTEDELLHRRRHHYPKSGEGRRQKTAEHPTVDRTDEEAGTALHLGCARRDPGRLLLRRIGKHSESSVDGR